MKTRSKRQKRARIPDKEKLVDNANEEKYEEYYPFKKYAKYSNGSEKYAKKRGSEFYILDDDNKPMFAKEKFKGDAIPYFATDRDGKPVVPEYNERPLYPFRDENTPIFPKEGRKEIYAKKDRKEMYPQNINDRQFYAKDEKDDQYPATLANGEAYYARERNDDKHIIEHAPKKKSGEAYYIEGRDSKWKYLFNIDLKRPLFPTDAKGENTYFKLNNDEEYYPENEDREQFYAKDANGFDKLARRSNGKYYYAKDSKRDDVYPQRPSGSEYYLLDANTELPAKRENDDMFYAKVNKDEYYPRIYSDGTERNLNEEPESIFVQHVGDIGNVDIEREPEDVAMDEDEDGAAVHNAKGHGNALGEPEDADISEDEDGAAVHNADGPGNALDKPEDAEIGEDGAVVKNEPRPERTALEISEDEDGARQNEPEALK
ncbi:hypothetical protein AVEN_112029-1 [Araneus ventricosus]|uniref:Uncharacterized protein n=1 Tax=Araneus ventricosus TaxID=182803 RepID=A0A4Y2QQD1_ARAVE|nr:hypothetical protein AVEN_112029-1 [Araneus ventricosus]